MLFLHVCMAVRRRRFHICMQLCVSCLQRGCSLTSQPTITPAFKVSSSDVRLACSREDGEFAAGADQGVGEYCHRALSSVSKMVSS